MRATRPGSGKPRFLALRDTIRDQILAGALADGALLPTEAELGARHQVSRVTVRKALDALKREGIVQSEQGRGTRVTLGRRGFRGSLDMVVLLAAVDDPFFARFYRHFEAAAGRTVVLVKHDPTEAQMTSVELYRRFLDKGIRDFVLWPRRGFGDHGLLPRLRGLGLNVVFFDHFLDTGLADCVGLDNRHAIAALVRGLRRRGARTLHYLGWQDVPLASTAEREAAFREATLGEKYASSTRISPPLPIDRLQRALPLRPQVDALLGHLRAERRMPDGFVCINSFLGSTLCEALSAMRSTSIQVAMVDDIHATHGLHCLHLAQPFEAMARAVFACLQEQNRLGPAWRARRLALPGRLPRA
jgi:DNA-binding LacI/PurR family transcriptional regulator